jgi:5-methyltetrahydrofolate--homocysteine methyltransferase
MRGSVDRAAGDRLDRVLPVLESAPSKLYGGKAILNSINFEDGEEAAEKRMLLARKHGAARSSRSRSTRQGMAKDVDDQAPHRPSGSTSSPA